MQKYTKGPWRAEINKFLHGEKFVQTIYNNKGDVIASVYGDTVEQCQANTDIILHSKGMFKVLRNIKKILTKEWPKEEWIQFCEEIKIKDSLRKFLEK